ncbi:MAG TPA: BrnA antitoxin family protein [Burkholderiales bacterium]
MKSGLVRKTSKQLAGLRAARASRTDWARVQRNARRGGKSDRDSPEVTPEQFARAVVTRGPLSRPGKALLSIRVDRDVVDWFRSQGRGYQTRINALLRAYRDAHIK